MNYIEDLKIDKFETKVNWIWTNEFLNMEQIVLDFFEEIDYEIKDLQSGKCTFDLELVLAEIKGKARNLKKNLDQEQCKILDKVIAIEYLKL